MASDTAVHPARRFGTPDGTLDLDAFLKELNDDKLRQLREGVERESRRRGLEEPPPQAATEGKPRTRQRKPRRGSPPRVESALTVGQQRLARAALAAGASPAVVAKELRVGRAQVAKLAGALKKGRPRRS
ncbi:MAG: hypothetical protein OXB97_11000 [Rhodospirillales bacterium]|nr:hypothetical protein [Rhodospirillales bacterium]